MKNLLTIFVTIKPTTLELKNVMYSSHIQPDKDANRTNRRCGFFERSRMLSLEVSALVALIFELVTFEGSVMQLTMLKDNTKKINVIIIAHNKLRKTQQYSIHGK